MTKYEKLIEELTVAEVEGVLEEYVIEKGEPVVRVEPIEAKAKRKTILAHTEQKHGFKVVIHSNKGGWLSPTIDVTIVLQENTLLSTYQKLMGIFERCGGVILSFGPDGCYGVISKASYAGSKLDKKLSKFAKKFLYKQ
jgi:hypothetical protein